MNIPCACHDFLRALITTRVDRDMCKDFYVIHRMYSLDERRSIKKSAQHCRLCQKIYNFLQNEYGPEFDLPDRYNQRFVTAWVKFSCLNGEEHLVSSIHLRCDSQTTWNDMDFAVWADKGMLSASYSPPWVISDF